MKKFENFHSELNEYVDYLKELSLDIKDEGYECNISYYPTSLNITLPINGFLNSDHTFISFIENSIKYMSKYKYKIVLQYENGLITLDSKNTISFYEFTRLISVDKYIGTIKLIFYYDKYKF